MYCIFAVYRQVLKKKMDPLSFILGALWGICLIVYYGTLNWAKFLFPSMFKKNIDNDTIVITGAGSGIGRLMALRFAVQGAKIISMDIDAKGNEETVK